MYPKELIPSEVLSLSQLLSEYLSHNLSGTPEQIPPGNLCSGNWHVFFKKIMLSISIARQGDHERIHYNVMNAMVIKGSLEKGTEKKIAAYIVYTHTGPCVINTMYICLPGKEPSFSKNFAAKTENMPSKWRYFGAVYHMSQLINDWIRICEFSPE